MPKQQESTAFIIEKLPKTNTTFVNDEAQAIVQRAERQLSDVVIASTLYDRQSYTQALNIQREFNKHVKDNQSCFTTSLIRGQYIGRDEFLLGHRNKTPEIVTFHPSKNIARVVKPFDSSFVSEVIGVFKQTDAFYGAHGSYVLNVPMGKYAKAYSGNRPLIFGEGPHVIHDQNFRVEKQNNALAFVNQDNIYINHGTLHILRVPAGEIATIWIGSVPLLLESRPHPYVFDTPLFRLEKNGDKYFHKATEKIIIHGSLKRLMPHTSEVAITYNNGILQIIHPQTDAGPTIINSATHAFCDFLSTGIQTLQFPSELTKRARRLENNRASNDEINYDIFSTRDSLKVGVKLLVAYRIADPEKALRHLNDTAGILDHIENVATVDMGKAIQQCSSQEFLCFYQTKPTASTPLSQNVNIPSAPPIQHFQDIVKDQLSQDLKEYGIELVRLNIETPKIMDTDIAKKMSEQSLRTAEAAAQQAVLQQKYDIETQEAERTAKAREIAQSQVNNATISQAQARLQAAEIDARAVIVQAEAKQKAAMLEGEIYLKNPALLELALLKEKMHGIAQAKILPESFMNRLLYTIGPNEGERHVNADTEHHDNVTSLMSRKA